MKDYKQAYYLKVAARSLRGLPEVQPPPGLNRSIMAALPRHRGFPGRLEYAARSLCAANTGKKAWKLLLPSGPGELGLFFLSAGVFFLCLASVILVRLHLAGLDTPLVPLFPALASCIIFMLRGWRQIAHPGLQAPLWPALGAANTLFALTVVLGHFSGIQPEIGLMVIWLGLSGLMVTWGLALAWKLCGSRPWSAERCIWKRMSSRSRPGRSRTDSAA